MKGCVKDKSTGWIRMFSRWSDDQMINIPAAENMFWCLTETVEEEEERQLIGYKLTACETVDQKKNKKPTQMSFCLISFNFRFNCKEAQMEENIAATLG